MRNKLMGVVLAGCCMLVPAAQAQTPTDLKCTMQFNLQGWSAFYKTYSGTGTVSCSDGSSMKVKLSSKGGGLTFGKSSIDDGHGEFTGVKNIKDVLGTYATGSAEAGAVKSSGVAGLTKGEISLAISGTGRGWNVGVDLGAFTIEEAQ
jgi:hypothetical protein